MSIVRMTWPSRDLSPNSRVHHMRLYRAKKTAKASAFALAKEAGLYAPEVGPINVHMTFYPPSKRRYDADNLIASMKAALDGIALAMKVDDHRFVPTWAISEATGGYVEIEVRG